MKKLLAIALLLILLLTLSVSCIGGGDEEPEDFDPTQQAFASAQEKLERDPYMQIVVSNDNYEMYVSDRTGEVYVKNKNTGKIFFTNPYNVTGISDPDEMSDALSQLAVDYTYTQTVDGYQTSELYSVNSYDNVVLLAGIDPQPVMAGTKTVQYAFSAGTRYVLPYGIMATDLIDMLFSPMQRQIEEDMREAAVESGVSERDLQKYFDYENFYGANRAIYSTEKMLGAEYSWGNMDAFRQWLRNAQIFYREFYRYTGDPEEGNSRPEDEQATMTSPVEMYDLADDYQYLESAYALVTPYQNYNGDSPAKWHVSDMMLEQFEILREVGAHPTLGAGYYCNAIFVLDQNLSADRYQELEALFAKYLTGYTVQHALKAERETKISPKLRTHFNLDITYELAGDELSVTVRCNDADLSVSDMQVTLFPGVELAGERGCTFSLDVISQYKVALRIPLP